MPKRHYFYFTSLAPERDVTAQDERDFFAKQLADGKTSKLSRLRVSDNYMRFYLKGIAPYKDRIERGCQIDYLIQMSSNSFYACEIKFNRKPLTMSVEESDYFDRIITAEDLAAE